MPCAYPVYRSAYAFRQDCFLGAERYDFRVMVAVVATSTTRNNGMVPEASSSIQLTTGNSVMDSDHTELIDLFECFEAGCNDRVSLDSGCAQCPDATVQSCRTGLMTIAGKVQALLLDHFQRENELMNLLPRTVTTTSHCVRHRREHVRFSTRYNHAVARLSAGQPGISSKQIEALLAEWIRSHMYEYDVELHALLSTVGVTSSGN